MNPLTLVKRTQKINSTEAALGISEEASWHAKYKDSAYVFVGGVPYELTEGDLLAVFAQYGEVVDVNLVRDKGTGKSKGFAFLAYEDQRSTTLAVDNLNGAKILGRIVRVDHVSNYKKKEEEDEEKEKQKREERGVCYAFQRGECNRGDSCRFSHDELRNANTGWGAKDTDSKWNNDRYDGPPKSHKNFSRDRSQPERNETSVKDEERYRGQKVPQRRFEPKSQEDRDRKPIDKLSDRHRSERDRGDDMDQREDEKRSRRDEDEKWLRHDYERRSRRDDDDKQSRHDEDEKRSRHDNERRSRHDDDPPPHHRRREDEKRSRHGDDDSHDRRLSRR